MEPTGEHGFRPEGGGFSCHDNKDRLRDLLGQVRIADLPQRR